MRSILIILIALTLGFCLYCGSKQTTSAPNTTDDGSGTPTDQLTGDGLNDATEVIGTVYAPSGDPVSGATIYVPTGTRSSGASSTGTYADGLTAADGTVCADPGEEYCAAACANADGTFTIDTSACTDDQIEMVIQKGGLIMTIVLDCSEGATCTLTANEGTFGGSRGYTTYPKVAVVTGDLDRMQDVLAKIAPLGYGTINSDNRLEPGDENSNNLTFIDGNGDLTGLSDYYTFDKYLNGARSLSDFDIVFINCGTSSEYEALLTSVGVRTVLSNYVNNGGTLYVTDLSYDYVNQVFPEFADFYGQTSQISAGALNAAQHGTGGIPINARVNVTSLATWLGTITVNAGSSGGPGNPDDDCRTLGASYSTRTGALNGDGTIPVGDLLNNWALIDNVYDSSTTAVISSGSYTLDGVANRLLTLSRNIGSGRVIYSSYHTADTCPTPNFWPQERVLEYLIFEVF